MISSTEEAKDGDWKDGKFHHFLREGEKQLLEFLVFFQPNAFVNGGGQLKFNLELVINCTLKILYKFFIPEKIQNFKALLTLKIDTDTDSDGVLQKIPIKGSAGFAKFLWNSSCSPFVFRVSEKGQSLTRWHLKVSKES